MLIPLIRFRWLKSADKKQLNCVTGMVPIGHITGIGKGEQPEATNLFGFPADKTTVKDLETMKSDMEADYLRYMQEVTGIWFKNEREWKMKVVLGEKIVKS